MPLLEIRHRTGMIETRELSKEVPLLVGRLASNDIHVDADGVAPVHCRISWKHKTFEVAAASPEGVQINGKMVRQKPLTAGDVIRVGEIDIVYLAELGQNSAPGAEHAPSLTFDESRDELDLPSDSRLQLKSVSEPNLPVRAFHLEGRFAGDMQKEKGHAAETPAGLSELPSGPPRAGSAKETAPPKDEERHGGMTRVARAVLDLDELADDEKRAESLDEPVERFASPLAAAKSRAQRVLTAPRVRPGERDPLRSPLVIGLVSGAMLLLLSAVTLWFVLSREKAQRQFDLAQSQLQSGQYPLAIESYTLFLRDYPRHALAAQARVDIGTARVEQAIGGGSPAWDKGLDELQHYIDEQRDTKGFEDPESPLRQFVLKSADKIAFGALETARQLHRRPLLAVSADAVKMIEFYSRDSRPEERLQELAKAARGAEAAILQQETFDAAAKKMDDALAEQQPAQALREYRRVLDRYLPADSPGYAAAAGNRALADRLKKACQLERTLTTRDEEPREAAAAAPGTGTSSLQLTLVHRIRARTDVASVGMTVFVLAEDCLYGIDSVTGEPKWRRVIGLDPPFAPVPVSAGQPALLVCDSRAKALLLLLQRTGEVLWRLPLAALPRGEPRVYEGQVYLATENNLLEQIDLQTGRSTARVRFTQKIGGPCAVSLSGERLYLPGHENVLYVLTRRPLSCEQVVWLGHAPGAIQAPAVMMRHLLLLAENERQDSCLLHLFDTSREDQKPVEITRQRVEGQVRDDPALRGNELFIPSSSERVSAFRVSETTDDKALVPVAAFQVNSPGGSPIFLATGPDDQVWMYSSALRRFELTPDSLLPAKQELAAGLASQPLQVSGDSLFLARRLPYSRGVLFSEADRQRMVVEWQVALGAGILASSTPAAQDGAAVCVTTLGHLFQVTPAKLARGGFDVQPLGQIPVPEGLSEPLSAAGLGDGRLAVYCGGDEPRLWLPGSDGMPREQKLPQALEAAPVRLAGGLLLALPGRLRLAGRRANEPAVEDLPAPIGQQQPPRWISVLGLDDAQAVVLSEQGRLARIRYGSAPVPHLEEITHWDALNPVDLPLASAGGRLYVADSTSRLVMLDASSLEPLAQVALEAAPAGPPRPAGELVVVELKTGRLAAYDTGAKLAKKWDVPLEGAALTGDPLAVGGRLLAARTDGRVLWLDAATGQAIHTADLGQQLAFGPQKWGETIVVGSLDGTIVVVKEPGDAAQ